MASVEPVSVSDLNGVAINSADILSDELVGYVSYIRNLTSDIGSQAKDPQGYQDFIDFQKEIDSAKISTFEADDIVSTDKFEQIDLTGENMEIRMIQMQMFMNMQQQILWANGGSGFNPFNMDENQCKIDGYVMKGNGLTPFDITGTIPTPKDELVLTA